MDTVDLKSEFRLKLFFELKENTESEFQLDAVDSETKLEPIKLVRLNTCIGA